MIRLLSLCGPFVVVGVSFDGMVGALFCFPEHDKDTSTMMVVGNNAEIFMELLPAKYRQQTSALSFAGALHHARRMCCPSNFIADPVRLWL